MNITSPIDWRALLTPIAIAIGVILLTAPASATAGLLAEEPLGEFGQPGTGAGELSFDSEGAGVAADPTTGHIFVSDSGNSRISEFTPWGLFVKAWGWGVDDGAEALQTCTEGTGCQEGIEGGGAGQFYGPSGIAVSPDGQVYVFEPRNHRVQVFSAAGSLLRAIGGDVVLSGPGDSSNDEVQELTIAATSGSFKLAFEDPAAYHPISGPVGAIAETGALPYNASAAEVETALNGLATISSHGGSVTVTGGPGDATGSNPYTVTFEGSLGGDDVPQLEVDRSNLGAAPIGARLVCSTESMGDTLSYQWLRNGAEIAGANSPVYTTVAADEGKAIQCRIRRSSDEGANAKVTNPAYMAPPVPPTAPPVAPSSQGLQLSELPVGGENKTLTCGGTDAWQGAVSFAYSWYLNGVEIPGATSPTYTATAADLAKPAIFQCGVKASNPGGATVKLSRGVETTPGPLDRVWNLTEDNTTFAASLAPVRTLNQGGGPEVCSVLAGDVCKPGRSEDAAGGFALETYERAGNPFDGDNLDVAADGTLYVGDWGRVQKFDPDGSFKASVPLPSSLASPAYPMAQALALDPSSGDLYVAFRKNVSNLPSPAYRLSPTGKTIYALPTRVVPSLAAGSNGIAFAADVPLNEATGMDAYPVLREIEKSGLIVDTCCEQLAGNGEKKPLPALATNVVTAAGGVDLYVVHSGSAPGDKRFASIEILGVPPDKWPAPAVAPVIEGQFAKSVGQETASLAATINPFFWADTAYRVEYGTAPCSEGGCSSTGERKLGAGVVRKSVGTPGVAVPGLQPNTTYHYRFVAESGGGGPVYGPDRTFTTFPASDSPDANCPNQSFRTGSSVSLPDCRAYELVSPVDKSGGEIIVNVNINSTLARLNQAAVSGDAITYSSSRSFGDAEASPYTSQYLARRGATGWATEGISPPQQSGVVGRLDSNYKAFSEDLSAGWLVQGSEPILAPGAVPGGFDNLYRRDAANGDYEALSTVAPPGVNVQAYQIQMQGFSADHTRTFFSANAPLTPNAAAPTGDQVITANQVYEFTKGKVRLVSLNASGTAAAHGASVGIQGGPLFGNTREANLATAISEDGTRVYWTEEGGSSPRLYVRVNAVKTVVVSEGSGMFWAATPDGEEAIYTEGDVLRRFDLSSGSSSTLVDTGVQGVLGQSEDLSRIYFTSTAALAGSAVGGSPNLYLYEEGQPLRFLATLSKGDLAGTVLSPVALSPKAHGAYVSADGEVAVFMSRAALTGADNAGGKEASEVFRYDRATDDLDCVSCSPTGEMPVPRDLIVDGHTWGYWYASRIPTWEFQLHAPRVIAAGGRRVFFNSLNRLVPSDTNGLEDAYQWEAAGTGTCTEDSADFSPPNGGCINLISGGRGVKDSEFIDASADGRDVFFITEQSMVDWDPAQFDIYDAREGGGMPPPPQPAAPCEGEACQGPVTLPSEPGLASQSFQGPGNSRSTGKKPCRKGFVRRNGKCVRKQASKKQKHRKHRGQKGGQR